MSSRTIILLLLACLGNACSSIVNIQVDDRTTFNDFEASMPLPNADDMRLRLRGSRIDGRFSQTIDSGDRINIEGTSISGPAEIDGEYEVTYWSLALGFDNSGIDLVPGQPAGAGYIGLGQTSFDLSLDDSGRVLSVDEDEIEIYFQYRFVQALTDSFTFGFAGAAGLTTDFDGSREYELILEYELTRQLILTGGYRWFDYFYFSDESDSDIELDFHGPVLGLKLSL